MMRSTRFGLGMGIAALGACLVVSSCSDKPAAAPEVTATATALAPAKVPFELFGTALDPQTASTVRETVAAVREFGTDASLRFTLVGIAAGKGERRSFASQGGPAEVDAGKLVACAEAAVNADRDKHLSVLECLFGEGGPVTRLEDCAAKTGLDFAAIKKCGSSLEGDKLLAAEFDYGRQREIMATPSIFIQSRPFLGLRTALELERAACGLVAQAEQPPRCATLPEPTPIKVFAISDERCRACNIAEPLEQLMNTVPGIVPERLDWSSQAAKDLLARAKLTKLPALVFAEGISQHPQVLSQLSHWIIPAGELHAVVLPSATWDPSSEVCDNGVDDTADGKVDCADPLCVHTTTCRKELPMRLDVFMLGACPVAANHMEAVEKLHEEMSDLRLGVHFIAHKKDGRLIGMRGPVELQEAMVELCGMKQAANEEKGHEFVFCRVDSAFKPELEECAEKAGLDVAALQKCAGTQEGDASLRADAELAEKLSIRRSPSYLINNRFLYEGGQEDIRKVFCSHNASAAACTKPAPSHEGHNH